MTACPSSRVCRELECHAHLALDPVELGQDSAAFDHATIRLMPRAACADEVVAQIGDVCAAVGLVAGLGHGYLVSSRAAGGWPSCRRKSSGYDQGAPAGRNGEEHPAPSGHGLRPSRLGRCYGCFKKGRPLEGLRTRLNHACLRAAPASPDRALSLARPNPPERPSLTLPCGGFGPCG